MQLSIRQFEDNDLPRIKAITVEAFEPVSIDRNIEERVGGPINGRDWRWRKARHIEHDVASDANGIFVAELSAQIVGYITTYHDPEASIGFIPNMAVIPEARGQGVGRQLVEYALAHFRRLNMKYARIETLEQNPVGQKLYSSLGFREIARQIHYGMPLDQG